MTVPFRPYPAPEQEQRLNRTLDLCRKLYNRAKEQRETAYRQEGKTITYSMQQNELPAFKKAVPAYKEVHSQVLQDCLRRLDDACRRFFRGEAGYLHYKSADRYVSLTYPQPGAVRKTFAREGYVYLAKIGNVKLKAHRSFDPTRATQINVVKRYTDQWMVNIRVNVPEAKPKPAAETAVGIDVGQTRSASVGGGSTFTSFS